MGNTLRKGIVGEFAVTDSDEVVPVQEVGFQPGEGSASDIKRDFKAVEKD